MEGALQELWRVTSAALERASPGIRFKSPWIPARVPISSTDETFQVNCIFTSLVDWCFNASHFLQTIVIEGTSSGGGIALDDIRLKPINCASNYLPIDPRFIKDLISRM